MMSSRPVALRAAMRLLPMRPAPPVTKMGRSGRGIVGDLWVTAGLCCCGLLSKLRLRKAVTSPTQSMGFATSVLSFRYEVEWDKHLSALSRGMGCGWLCFSAVLHLFDEGGSGVSGGEGLDVDAGSDVIESGFFTGVEGVRGVVPSFGVNIWLDLKDFVAQAETRENEGGIDKTEASQSVGAVFCGI